MQSAGVKEKSNEGLSTAVLLLIIGMALILFVVVIGRMGLLNRWAAGETAVAADTLQLTAEAMRFGQPELQVKAGQEVTLVLDNHDLYGHSFDVDGLDLHVEMVANGRATITFTPIEADTYLIYCAVPGHREAGMVSTLVVEP
jgi:uncharacterized cupredoxin-like copper-binding protein